MLKKEWEIDEQEKFEALVRDGALFLDG